MATTPVWDMYVGDSSSPDGDDSVPFLTGRKFTRILDQPDAWSFSFNGRTAKVPAIVDLATDLIIRRTPAKSTTSQAIQRFRVFPTTDDVGDTVHTVDVTAKGYEAILSRRYLNPSDTLYWAPGTDQAALAWYLVNVSQARTGGALGITQGAVYVAGVLQGSFLTGTTVERTYKAGDSCGTLLSQLSQVLNGFDYEIDYNRKLNIWSPARGKTGSDLELLQWGGNVSSVKRTFNDGDYASAVTVTGDGATTPVQVASATIGTDLRGRWEDWQNEPSISEPQTLTDRAGFQLALRSAPSYGYSVVLRQGVWQGLGHIDVGDHVNLVVKSLPRVNTNIEARVRQISIGIGDDGSEDVTMTVEAV